MNGSQRGRRIARIVAIVGTLVLFAYAVVAAVQIAVLNPLAAVPGAGLEQIRADVAAAGESLGSWWVLMAGGPAIGTVLLVRSWKHPDVHPHRLAMTYLVVLALGALAYFVASFAPGMALADTYLISGTDHSPWSMPLYAVSALAVVAGIGLEVWRAARISRSDGTVTRASVPGGG